MEEFGYRLVVDAVLVTAMTAVLAWFESRVRHDRRPVELRSIRDRRPRAPGRKTA